MKDQQKSVKLLIEDLEVSKLLGQLLLDNANEAHFFYSMEGKLIYISPAFQKITGYTTQELYEKNFVPYVHPDDRERTMKLWQGLFKGEFFEDIEYRIVRKDGEIRWNSSSCKIVLDSDGRQIGIQGKHEDITKRKLVEQQFNENEQYNRMLFEETPVGLVLSRKNGDLIDLNPAYASIIGRTVEETLKLSYWDITPEKDVTKEQRQLELLEKTGRNDPYKKEYIHKNGNLVPVRVSRQILKKGGETLIWSSVEDITGHIERHKVMQRSEVLEKLTTDTSLNDILTSLVINAEKRSPGTFCSVLLLDDDGKHLHHGAAPNLPDFYNEAIDGVEIGLAECSCGAAANTGRRVIIQNIMAKPELTNYRELAKKAGLQASWSEPIISSTGVILGTFTIYYREPREPQQQDIKFIQNSARLAGIAIERKQADEALKDERDKAQRYLDTVEAIMVALDTSGNITLVNRKGCELLGYNEQELIGKNWFETFLHSKDRKNVEQVFIDLVKGKVKPVEYYENTILTRNREERIIAWHNSILRDEHDNIIGTLGAGEDITKRKQTEEELQESEQKFRSIFDFAPLGMAVVDEKGYPTIHNAALQNMLGYREEELSSMAFVEFTHPDDATKDLKLYEALYNNRLPSYSMEKRYIHKDGSIVWGALTVSAVRDENNKFRFAVGMVDDITDRKKAELKAKDLLTQNRDLTRRLFQAQEQERRHLARELHDEYGQWLTALRMHAHLLDERFGESELEMRDSIKVIEKISLKMHESIRRMIHELRPVDLNQLGLNDSLQDLVDHWRELYPQINCILSMKGNFDDIDNMLGVTIYRIIQESLTNVAKHAEANNVSIQLSRRTDQSENFDFLLLRIEDDGKGIHLDEPTKGFGLAGMRERALAARGKFIVKRSPGDGTLIEVRLPVTAEEIERNSDVE